MNLPILTRRSLIIVMACAIPRLLYAVIAGVDGTDTYPWLLSDALLTSGTLAYDGVPTAAFDPLHPVLLAAARLITGDQVWAIVGLQIAAACVAAVWLDRLVRRMSGSSRAGWVAAGAYAASPYLIRQSAAGWLEITVLQLLLIAAWLAWTGGASLKSIGLLALATLTRAVVLPILGLALIWVVWHDRRRALPAVLLVLLLLGPWAVRNIWVGGTPWPSRQAAILYAGNNPLTTAMVPAHDMDLFHERAPELVPNGDYRRAVVDYVRTQPLDAAWTKLRNLAWFFSPRLVPRLPRGPDSTLVIGQDGTVETRRPRQRAAAHVVMQEGFALVLLVLAAVGLYRRRRDWRQDGILLASVAVFALVAAVYYPTTRQRTAIDPIVMAYAGCACLGRRPKEPPDATAPSAPHLRPAAEPLDRHTRAGTAPRA